MIKRSITYKTVKESLAIMINNDISTAVRFKITKYNLINGEDYESNNAICIYYTYIRNIDAEIIKGLQGLVRLNKYFVTHFNKGVFVKWTILSEDFKTVLTKNEYWTKIYRIKVRDYPKRGDFILIEGKEYQEETSNENNT